MHGPSPHAAPSASGLPDSVFVRCEPRRNVSHIVFDFDGTLSWVRHGWPELMFETFRIHWPVPEQTRDAAWRTRMESIVYGMNGQPSVLQMQRYAEVAAKAGAQAADAESLRGHFQAALDREIEARLGAIAAGAAPREAFVIHGARPLLEHLRARGFRLVILSSSIEHRVRQEADALGLSEYFDNRIYGSGSDPRGFSKWEVFNRLLESERISGDNLLSFGDGPVEIECTKKLGGLAVAVCSDEDVNGSGVAHPYKFRQLLESGADAAIPDFTHAIGLMEHLAGGGKP
jgi:phosphoglycolate phosphatase-like HAD superfamily hydrolase